MYNTNKIQRLEAQRLNAIRNWDVSKINELEYDIAYLKDQDNKTLEKEYHAICQKKGIPYSPLKN